MGSAARGEERLAALRILSQGPARRGGRREASRVLTPVTVDPPALIPVVAATGSSLMGAAAVNRLSAAAVHAYEVTPKAIAAVAAALNPDTEAS